MNVTINGDFGAAEVDLRDFVDISIPMRFDGPQPNAFGVEPASSKACEYGDLVGDTRRGGSCNFEQITLIPHCNGTHTECVGHITNERISVRACLNDSLIEAVLITVRPEASDAKADRYSMSFDSADTVITRRALSDALASSGGLIIANAALIIRTLPNDDRKLTRQYGQPVPPYFTTQAMELIVESGFKHLLVDLPSIDRLYDEGRLSNHRLFWNVKDHSFETNSETRIESTVTEMIYVPNEVEDGSYLLNLQIAPFESDASPSRPVLFKMQSESVSEPK